MALAAGILHRGFWSDLWEDSHRRALRQAARIVVLGEDMRERIIGKGVEPARVSVIRDAVAFTEFPTGANEAIVREIRRGFRFVIVHAGNLGFYGAWHTLICSAQMLESHGVGLVFIGEGAMKKEIQAAAQNCRSIRFMPFFPLSQLLPVMASGGFDRVILNTGVERLVVAPEVSKTLRQSPATYGDV